jgi:hypothetical protein
VCNDHLQDDHGANILASMRQIILSIRSLQANLYPLCSKKRMACLVTDFFKKNDITLIVKVPSNMKDWTIFWFIRLELQWGASKNALFLVHDGSIGLLLAS